MNFLQGAVLQLKPSVVWLDSDRTDKVVSCGTVLAGIVREGGEAEARRAVGSGGGSANSNKSFIMQCIRGLGLTQPRDEEWDA